VTRSLFEFLITEIVGWMKSFVEGIKIIRIFSKIKIDHGMHAVIIFLEHQERIQMPKVSVHKTDIFRGGHSSHP